MRINFLSTSLPAVGWAKAGALSVKRSALSVLLGLLLLAPCSLLLSSQASAQIVPAAGGSISPLSVNSTTGEISGFASGYGLLLAGLTTHGTGVLEFPNGAADATSGITFGSPYQAAIYRPATNTLRFDAGGTPLTWDGVTITIGSWGGNKIITGPDAGSGNPNRTGQSVTIQGGTSTGSGAGGSLIFQTTPAGGAGSSLNAYVTVLTLGSDLSTICAGQLIGKGTATNDSAAAGYLGEYVSSLVAVGSAVSLTTATAADITSISLTAGDWDVEYLPSVTESTSTVTARVAGISTTSATLPTDGSEGYCGVQSTVTSEINSIPLNRKRLSLASTTTVYAVEKVTFSAGTAAGFGSLNARRVR